MVRNVNYLSLNSTSFFLVIFSLFFSVTNLVPFSLLFFMSAPLAIFLVFSSGQLDRVAFLALFLFLYFIIYAAFYDFGSFFEPLFFRKEGGLILSYFPFLFLFSFVWTRFCPRRLLVFWFCMASALNLLLLILWFFDYELFYSGRHYHFLFKAHNAAGGFLAIMIISGVWVYWKVRRLSVKAIVVLSLVCNVVALYFSDSRGTMLSLLAVFFLLFFIRFGLLFRYISLVILCTVFSVGLAIFGSKNFSPNNSQDQWQSCDLEFSDERSWTLFHRLCEMYPRALSHFEMSPIIGVGFGSYNDYPYEFYGVDGVLVTNVTSYKYVGSGLEGGSPFPTNPHNFYLSVLGSTGVLGFLLVFFTIGLLFHRLKYMAPKSDYELVFHIFALLAFSSITESRLESLSQTVPFILIAALFYNCNKYVVSR